MKDKIVEFDIRRDDISVGHHQQKITEPTEKLPFMLYQPLEDHTVTLYGTDDNDNPWRGEPMRLDIFLMSMSEFLKGR